MTPAVADYMTPREAMAALRIRDRRTLVRWANLGLLEHFTTPGGHRRYIRASVQALLEQAKELREQESARGAA